MKTEADIKKEIVAYLKSVGAWWDNPVRTGYGRRGVPDIVGCYKGNFFALEVKRDATKEATPWQKREIAAIHEANGLAAVVHCVEQVKALIEHFDLWTAK